jgi:hypothetical protein
MRISSTVFASAVVMLAACSHSGYAVRPVPRIVADGVGKPVSRLREVFGEPRKIDTAANKEVYVWFLEQAPDGAPTGLHGCELEVTVDVRSDHVLGYSSSNIGWTKCSEIERKVRIVEP